jgi:hypothetical protein
MKGMTGPNASWSSCTTETGDPSSMNSLIRWASFTSVTFENKAAHSGILNLLKPVPVEGLMQPCQWYGQKRPPPLLNQCSGLEKHASMYQE